MSGIEESSDLKSNDPAGGAMVDDLSADEAKTDSSMWLWASVEPLLAAIGANGLHVQQLVATPQPFGSWYVDVVGAKRRHRIVMDGKDRLIILQSAVAPDGWEDIRTLFADHLGSWIGEAVHMLERHNA